MAGSLRHVIDDGGNYRGVDLLENTGDMHEAVEQMAFMLMLLSRSHGGLVRGAEDSYYECRRGEKPWPIWFENHY